MSEGVSVKRFGLTVAADEVFIMALIPLPFLWYSYRPNWWNINSEMTAWLDRFFFYQVLPQTEMTLSYPRKLISFKILLCRKQHSHWNYRITQDTELSGLLEYELIIMEIKVMSMLACGDMHWSFTFEDNKLISSAHYHNDSQSAILCNDETTSSKSSRMLEVCNRTEQRLKENLYW